MRYLQKRCTFPQKNAIFPQKSSVSPQKSPREVYSRSFPSHTHTRRTRGEALVAFSSDHRRQILYKYNSNISLFDKNQIFVLQQAFSILVAILLPFRGPHIICVVRSWRGISVREAYISAKEHYISAKEPCISATEPFREVLTHNAISAKEVHISAKERNISAKELCISAKEP